MIISRQAYEDMRDERQRGAIEVNALTQVNAQLNAHIEWMRVRITQLEFERAQLLHKYMGIDMPVPTFEPSSNIPFPNAPIDFSDVGDETAEKLGLGWADDGTLVNKKA